MHFDVCCNQIHCCTIKCCCKLKSGGKHRWPSYTSDVYRLDVISTVVVVENVEDVLPFVMLDDVDDGGSVQRSDKKRERNLIVRGLVCAVAVDGRQTAERSAQAAAQRLVDGRRRVDDRKLERGGELGDDVGRRT